MQARHADARVDRIISAFESLSPRSLDALVALYSDLARFKDPFNDVQGRAAIRGIFSHMFEQTESPRFTVLDAVVQGDHCFLTWDFHFIQPRLGPARQCIHGSSHLRFDAAGCVTLHRDYWDAAEELYEKLPVVGALMRWLRRRAQA